MRNSTKLSKITTNNTAIAEMIAQEIPELVEQADLLVDHLHVVVTCLNSQSIGTQEQQAAHSEICNQFFNDYLGVLGSCLVGDGRSAMSATRALYEHLVNYGTCEADPHEATRYIEHESVVMMTYHGWADPIYRETLSGQDLRSYNHWSRVHVRDYDVDRRRCSIG